MQRWWLVGRRTVRRVVAPGLLRRPTTSSPFTGAPWQVTTRTAQERIDLVSFSSQSSYRCFSSTNDDTSFDTTRSSSSPTSLRNFIKPFLLRCHPDVQTAPDAKQVNLKAIQNLNSYLDSMENLISSSKKSWQPRQQVSDDEKTVEIDFVIMVQEHHQAKKRHRGVLQTSASRRKVQLAWPPSHAVDHRSTKALLQHVRQEMAKLLRVAGLPVPVELELSSSTDDDDIDADDLVDGDELDDKTQVWADVLDLDKENERMEMWERYYNNGKQKATTASHYARRAAARRRFTRSIDWKKVDAMYKQAWRSGALRRSAARDRLNASFHC